MTPFADVYANPTTLRRIAAACRAADDEDRAGAAALLIDRWCGWGMPRWALRYIDWGRIAADLEAEARRREAAQAREARP